MPPGSSADADDGSPADDDDDDHDDSSANADVEAVTVSGEPGEYSFSVTLRSPDTGCDQYADWWEVLGEDGSLLYRRILAHSHVDEQPFTRSGGPVDIQADTLVFVRAHMNTSGYGGIVFSGTVGGTFAEATSFDTEAAAAVETQEPLPESCAF